MCVTKFSLIYVLNFYSKMNRLPLILFCLSMSLPSAAVITRHDIPAESYLAGTSDNLGYMVGLPYEGHGALIHPQWVVTVAHTVFGEYSDEEVSIDGINYPIDKVIIHPGYKKVPQALLEQVTTNGIMDHLLNNDDVALIKLKAPIGSAHPILLSKKGDAELLPFNFYGRGATGTGLTGDMNGTKKDHILRKGENHFEKAERQWLIYRFDKPENGMPYEAMPGSGDSGAGLVDQESGILLGLVSWQYWQGELKAYQSGVYGREAYSVRISYYREWIDEVIKTSVIKNH